MKFRSWHLVLIGILLQIIFAFIYLSNASSENEIVSTFVLGIVGITLIFGSLLGIIPLILLIFEKTRKIGGVISIIFGIFGIILKAGFIVGIFLIIAGILSLWKKI